MFRLFLTPQWFNGVDLVFDSISLVVAFLIAAYSWSIYRKQGENKFAYFALAFVFVGLAFLFKIITQGLIYYAPWRTLVTQALIPVVGKGTTGINYSDLFFRGGFFMSMVTMLGAWLLIFFVSQRRTGRLQKYYDVSQIALFAYLLILISIVSNFKYFVFFLTSCVILGMTVLNYYKNYLNTNCNPKAFWVMMAFLAILVGNIFFVFVVLTDIFYVVGEIFMLVGFLMLLHTYRSIRRR